MQVKPCLIVHIGHESMLIRYALTYTFFLASFISAVFHFTQVTRKLQKRAQLCILSRSQSSFAFRILREIAIKVKKDGDVI